MMCRELSWDLTSYPGRRRASATLRCFPGEAAAAPRPLRLWDGLPAELEKMEMKETKSLVENPI